MEYVPLGRHLAAADANDTNVASVLTQQHRCDIGVVADSPGPAGTHGKTPAPLAQAKQHRGSGHIS